MKRATGSIILFLFLAVRPLRAADEAPQIPIEVTDDRDDGSNLGFMLRDKFRASSTFKIVPTTTPRLHLQVTTITNQGIVSCSLAWTYASPAVMEGRGEKFLAHAVMVINERTLNTLPDTILADTEKVWQHFQEKTP